MSQGRENVSAATLRIVDAAANRAREGIRVVEDFVRFVWDDKHLTEQLKQLRHDLAKALGALPADWPLACRDTPGDVGTGISAATETSRANEASVATANFKRLQESLRSLEEFSKTFDSELAASLEQLRYRAYTLERAVGMLQRGTERLADARLYVLLDGRESAESLTRLARQLIEAGVDAIQLRDKRLSDRELLDRARQLRQLTAGTGTLFIMNDRPDVALLAAADGVHVGQDELPLAAVRRVAGPQMLIGVSTHSMEQARQGVLDGADYLGLGPTFASGTKSFDQFPGLSFLRQAAAEIRLPAFAIGGISRDNLAQVLATGVHRIAVGGAIVSASGPGEMARWFVEALRP